jgi:hypothetical protein
MLSLLHSARYTVVLKGLWIASQELAGLCRPPLPGEPQELL